MRTESFYQIRTPRQQYWFIVYACCGLFGTFGNQVALADDDCEDFVCIILEQIISDKTYDVPPDVLEFDVYVTQFPDEGRSVTVHVQLTRKIAGEEIPIHILTVKLPKKRDSDIASKNRFWNLTDSKDKKGKEHRLVVILELEDEKYSNETQLFNIKWQ